MSQSALESALKFPSAYTLGSQSEYPSEYPSESLLVLSSEFASACRLGFQLESP